MLHGLIYFFLISLLLHFNVLSESHLPQKKVVRAEEKRDPALYLNKAKTKENSDLFSDLDSKEFYERDAASSVLKERSSRELLSKIKQELKVNNKYGAEAIRRLKQLAEFMEIEFFGVRYDWNRILEELVSATRKSEQVIRLRDHLDTIKSAITADEKKKIEDLDTLIQKLYGDQQLIAQKKAQATSSEAVKLREEEERIQKQINGLYKNAFKVYENVIIRVGGKITGFDDDVRMRFKMDGKNYRFVFFKLETLSFSLSSESESLEIKPEQVFNEKVNLPTGESARKREWTSFKPMVSLEGNLNEKNYLLSVNSSSHSTRAYEDYLKKEFPNVVSDSNFAGYYLRNMPPPRLAAKEMNKALFSIPSNK